MHQWKMWKLTQSESLILLINPNDIQLIFSIFFVQANKVRETYTTRTHTHTYTE